MMFLACNPFVGCRLFCFFVVQIVLDMIEKLPFYEDSYMGYEYRDEELLDYMVNVADHFCPSVDPDCFEIVTCEDGKKREGKRIGNLQPSMHPNMFANRFLEDKVTGYREEEYLADHTLQKMLNNFELDKEKFWYLCLYVKDYTLDKTNGIVSENSAVEDLEDVLESILENITFTFPFKPSKEVGNIVNDEKHHPYYEKDENGHLKQIVPEEFVEARKKYFEEKSNWKPEYNRLMSLPKEQLTQNNISNILKYLLNSNNYKNETWYFEKNAKLSLRIGTGHSLEVTNPKALVALAYALNLMKDDFNNIDSLNIGSIDFDNKISLGDSYKLFQFNKMLGWFLKDKKTKGIPFVPTNKYLLISKMVYYTGLSNKEDLKKDYFDDNVKKKILPNNILKDAIKKVNEKKLKKMHNNIYWQ